MPRLFLAMRVARVLPLVAVAAASVWVAHLLQHERQRYSAAAGLNAVQVRSDSTRTPPILNVTNPQANHLCGLWIRHVPYIGGGSEN